MPRRLHNFAWYYFRPCSALVVFGSWIWSKYFLNTNSLVHKICFINMFNSKISKIKGYLFNRHDRSNLIVIKIREINRVLIWNCCFYFIFYKCQNVHKSSSIFVIHLKKRLNSNKCFPGLEQKVSANKWLKLYTECVITALFTKPPASRFPAIPWFCLVQFLKLP